jgi:monoamine oxidase
LYQHTTSSTDKTVVFEPNLPEDIVQVAKKRTWMGESIKFAVEYTTPFWREKLFRHLV